MEFLQQYGSESDHSEPENINPVKTISLAPDIDIELKTNLKYHDQSKSMIYNNPTYQQLYAPRQGPELPFSNSFNEPQYNTPTGHVEKHNVDNFVFDEQYHTFQSYGFAKDPSQNNAGKNVIGNKDGFNELQGSTVFRCSKSVLKNTRKKKLKRESQGNPADVDSYKGPWAPIIEDEEYLKNLMIEQEKRKKEYVALQNEKKKKLEEEKERKKRPKTELLSESEETVVSTTKTTKPTKLNVPDCAKETSVLEYSEERDYQGRTYMYYRPDEEYTQTDTNFKCYIPKNWIHTWNGHTKAVTGIRFFPKTGHLLLSASMDKTIKIWDVNSHRQCLRTMSGHFESVKDITFNNDGTQIMSVSPDKWIKIWDTETGQCISRFTSGKVPLMARYYPENENEFLVAQKDKLIVGWDIRQKSIIQRYSEHMSSVNTVTFLDQNRRFVSTSDDKKILFWEYGIPVVIKHISEPFMHSVPFISVSPDEKWCLGQSLDNQIIVFGAEGKFRYNRKKRFTGHIVSGYACQASMSPDGQFVVSGDYEGRVFFWDWKTTRVYKRIKAHDKVTIGAVWHPFHPSKVATCSWDGTIKYWD